MYQFIDLQLKQKSGNFIKCIYKLYNEIKAKQTLNVFFIFSKFLNEHDKNMAKNSTIPNKT
jgi:hypothetical protein